MPVPHWFQEAKFGLFIHWDHASQQGCEISWPLVGRSVSGRPAPTVGEYHSSAATFDPSGWDPARLARLAREAGMRYAVFTAKHHSGWAAWPSSHAPFTIASSPYGRRGGDLVREYTDAFRSEGIRVGLYYSLCDWSHPAYPPWTDDQLPYRGRVEIQDPEQWKKFQSVLKAQIAELLTVYGPIDLLWFDGQWERTPEEWQVKEIRKHILNLAPDIVMNDRLPTAGDYSTPEQYIPAQGLDGPWESCMTLNNSWAYIPEDSNYKSVAEVLRALTEVVSRGGNLLLNIGPQGNGTIPQPEVDTLQAIGTWMAQHSEAIHGAQAGLQPWQFYGPTTRKDRSLYLHMVGWPETSTVVRAITANPTSATILSTGETLEYHLSGGHGIGADHVSNLTIKLPAERPTTTVPVIKVTFDDPNF